MSESSTYQEIRSHLAYLRLGAAAEALPGELDHARERQARPFASSCTVSSRSR